jgi:hypothetical protein
MDRNTTTQYSFRFQKGVNSFEDLKTHLESLKNDIEYCSPTPSSKFSQKFNNKFYSVPFNDHCVNNHLATAASFLDVLIENLNDENKIVTLCIEKLNDTLQLLKSNRSFERESSSSLLSAFENSSKRPYGARKFRK